MQEYWVNVYRQGEIGKYKTKSREKSIKVADDECVYRIHVKMKPLYLQSVGRSTILLKQTEWANKLDWMG